LRVVEVLYARRDPDGMRADGWDEVVQGEMIALLPRLRRFALALTGKADVADDLVQATCERAIRHLEQWTPGTRLDSWMYKIAQNLHRSQIRDSSNRLRILEERLPVLPAVLDGAEAADNAATLAQVRALVLALPAEQRAVLMLVCVEGFSYQEVADMLELPLGTVTSRLARARLQLKAALDGPAELTVIAQRRCP
jgi:RNA polymerase sigma-70 factor (ECF subfamily)